MFKEIITSFCDLVYPPKCVICSNFLNHSFLSRPVCVRCFKRLPKNKPPFCPICTRPLTTGDLTQCKNCSTFPPSYDFAWCACTYKLHLPKLLHRYKYQQRTYMRVLFGELMKTFISTHLLDIAQFDYLLPIPLHSTRLRERSFNQSLLLANELKKSYNIPILKDYLIRKKYTAPQTFLGQKERFTNIAGAFTIKNSQKITDKSILLIDDLLTTGATVSEAARILKNSGAKKACVFTLAIA